MKFLGRKWLNDEVINFYFQLMMERAKENPALPQLHAFSTFLYPTVKKRGHSGVKRWTRKVDLFAQVSKILLKIFASLEF